MSLFGSDDEEIERLREENERLQEEIEELRAQDDVPESLTTDDRFDLPGEWAFDEAAKTAVRFSAPMPFSAKFWRKVIKTGYKGLRKSAGGASGSADALFHTYRGNNKLDIVPVARYRDPDDPTKPDLWHTPDWQDMWVGSGGEDIVIGPGNTPVGVASGSYYAVGDQLDLRVDKAFTLGDDRPLYENPTFNVLEQVERKVYTDPRIDPEAGGGEAVADGGEINVDAVTAVEDEVVGRELSLDQVAGLSDHVIDLENTDNRLLSYYNYKESHPEKLASEEHKMSEERGRLAEQDPDRGRLVMKLLIIAGLIVVGSLAAVFVLPQLLGGGGGGGINIPSPLLTGLAGLLGP